MLEEKELHLIPEQKVVLYKVVRLKDRCDRSVQMTKQFLNKATFIETYCPLGAII